MLVKTTYIKTKIKSGSNAAHNIPKYDPLKRILMLIRENSQINARFFIRLRTGNQTIFTSKFRFDNM